MGLLCATGEVPHNCEVAMCDHPDGAIDDIRAAWGCERETETPQLDADNKPIELCGVPLHRCPRAMLKENSGDLRALRYFNGVLDPHKVLPEAGGWNDQTATFCAVQALLQNEKNRITNRQHERAMAQAKRR